MVEYLVPLPSWVPVCILLLGQLGVREGLGVRRQEIGVRRQGLGVWRQGLGVWR